MQAVYVTSCSLLDRFPETYLDTAWFQGNVIDLGFYGFEKKRRVLEAYLFLSGNSGSICDVIPTKTKQSLVLKFGWQRNMGDQDALVWIDDPSVSSVTYPSREGVYHSLFECSPKKWYENRFLPGPLLVYKTFRVTLDTLKDQNVFHSNYLLILKRGEVVRLSSTLRNGKVGEEFLCWTGSELLRSNNFSVVTRSFYNMSATYRRIESLSESRTLVA